MSESFKEILSGPGTLLVYLVVLAGFAVILLGDDADFDKYKEFVGPDGIAFPLLGLLVGRGIAKAGAGIGPAKSSRKT